MIKVICFDLDGVYFKNKGKKAFHEALIRLSGSEDKATYVLYKSPEMLQFVTGKLTEDKFWSFVRDYLGLTLTNEEFGNLWIKEYEIDPKVREAVLIAKTKKYLTAICSNNNPTRIKALEKHFGFLKDFDVKIFSYDVGFVKPSKEIFQALINKSDVKPNEIVYSDDNPERIQGAIDLGIIALKYENFLQFLEKLEEFGVSLKI